MSATKAGAGSDWASLVVATPFHAIGMSAKLIVSSTAAVSVLLSESWTPLYYISGALCNALLNKVIKRVLRQPRPAASKKGGYGMPSSHAYLLFYFLTVVSRLSRQHYPSHISTVVSIVLGVYAATASSWRVSDGLHSVAQTGVGASLGVATGLLAHAYERQALAGFSGKVPSWLKAVVLTSGGLALYSRELRKLRELRRSPK